MSTTACSQNVCNTGAAAWRKKRRNLFSYLQNENNDSSTYHLETWECTEDRIMQEKILKDNWLKIAQNLLIFLIL